MNWFLVFIGITGAGVESDIEGRYQSLTECFQAREALAVVKGGGAPGYYPLGSQGICIYALTEGKES